MRLSEKEIAQRRSERFRRAKAFKKGQEVIDTRQPDRSYYVKGRTPTGWVEAEWLEPNAKKTDHRLRKSFLPVDVVRAA